MNSDHDTMRRCERCQTYVAPRNAGEPRFCPQCGAPLIETPPATRVTTYAFASIVCGVFLVLGPLGPVAALIGVISGIIAHGRIAESGGRLTGRGIATAGILLNLIGASIKLLMRHTAFF
ncbi:MAG: DUF4190 domain-containing protein [Phycisphaerae bacterium]